MPDNVATYTQDEEFRQLVTDIKLLSELSGEQVDHLVDAFHASARFYSIEKVAAVNVANERVAKAVVRLVSSLPPESVKYVLGMVRNWWKSLEDPDSYMKEQDLENGFDALRKLICNSPSISRVKKAQALKTATGNELFGVMFVCDARPVFSPAKDGIEGYIPVTTMKLIYQRQNGDSEETEFALMPDEIDLLIDRATKAREKVKVLDASMSQFLPNAIEEECGG